MNRRLNEESFIIATHRSGETKEIAREYEKLNYKVTWSKMGCRF